MRALFVGINYDFINPAARLLPRMIGAAVDTDFFGPGFNSAETLRAGLPAFFDEHGPYDIAFTTEMVLQNRRGEVSFERLKQVFRRSSSATFPLADLQCVGAIADAWDMLDCPRIVSLMQSDYYCWNEGFRANVSESSDVVLALDTNHLVPAALFGVSQAEPRLVATATDLYADFIRSESHRVVNFPHFVAVEEFCFDSFRQRPRIWSVPGVEYRQRSAAKTVLRERGYRLPRRSPVQYVGKLTALVGTTPTIAVSVPQSLFRHQLRRARAAYTCGSAARMTVRKFFEIPAAGALLACQPSANLTDYGFIDGANCFFTDGADIGAVDSLVRDEPQRAQQVALAGQRLVLRNHSLPARCDQLRKVLQSVHDGDFNGARWRDGEFRLEASGRSTPT